MVGDCLVVEPVADTQGPCCGVCTRYLTGDDGLHRGESCGYIDCGLRLGVLEALGIDPDPELRRNYGWKVSGSPFSMLVKLNKRFKCQVMHLNGEEGDDWAVARAPKIKVRHAQTLQTLMALRSIRVRTSTSDVWLLEQLRMFQHDVVLRLSSVHTTQSRRVLPVSSWWGDKITRWDVEDVFATLSRVRGIEVAS